MTRDAAATGTTQGPSITDRQLFVDLVRAICDHPDFPIVGITGGEPFVERWGLDKATSMLSDAGKSIVLYTSAIWASEPAAKLGWELSILRRTATVVLSSDAFHSRRVSADTLRAAVHLVLDAGAHPVMQYLALPGAAPPVRFMEELLGSEWNQTADLKVIELVNEGRAAKHGLWRERVTVPGEAVGSCHAVQPTVRYDGVITKCCNANVMFGRGPDALRTTIQRGTDLRDELDRIKSSGWLRYIAHNGLGPLTRHPHAELLAQETYAPPCDLCWKLLERVDVDSEFTKVFVGLLPPATHTRGEAGAP